MQTTREPTRSRALVRESQRLRRETALTMLFSATLLLSSRLCLQRTRESVPAK